MDEDKNETDHLKNGSSNIETENVTDVEAENSNQNLAKVIAEHYSGENGEAEIATEENIDADASEVPENSVTDNKTSEKSVQRLTHLPIARVKHIMKFDDDVHYATQEAIFLVTKATVSISDLFV